MSPQTTHPPSTATQTFKPIPSILYKAKSLKFLSLDGLYEALNKGKRNNTYPQFSDHYFTGDYPVKPSDNLGEEKIKQLSLLSSKSSN